MSKAATDALDLARESFQQAVADARAGHWQPAALGFIRAWRAAPDRSQAAQGLLECALQRVRSGAEPPAMTPIGRRAEGSFSFVVCSIDPLRLNRLRADLERHFAGETWELVHIDDARSLSEGYQRGLIAARGELMVFCHDDIGIVSSDFAARLRRHLAAVDLVGLAGSDRACGPAWHWAGPPHTASWVSLPRPDGSLVAGLLGANAPLLENAQLLDGVLLAGRRSVFEQLAFDGDNFDGFHFYDLDLSYRAHLAGLRCAVATNVQIWHQSGGNFSDAAWHHAAARFLAKFPELNPVAPCAPYRTGALPIDSVPLASATYAWIEYWLSIQN